jgi:hypothetical protein
LVVAPKAVRGKKNSEIKSQAALNRSYLTKQAIKACRAILDENQHMLLPFILTYNFGSLSRYRKPIQLESLLAADRDDPIRLNLHPDARQRIEAIACEAGCTDNALFTAFLEALFSG